MLDHPFGDPELDLLLGDAARIRAMLRVEAALARAEADAGLITTEAAVAIEAAVDRLVVEPERLARAAASDGVPVPALVGLLRQATPAPHADQVHRGATSQDVVDTGFVLVAIEALAVLDARVGLLVHRLCDLALAHAATPMAGRTRYQLASPTSFGLRVAGWAAALARHRARLEELRPRFGVVSLAGASGTLGLLGEAGPRVVEGLAHGLGLGVPDGPWHAARDRMAELGGWLGLVTGSLGKLGLDVLMLAQNEVAEVVVAGGGTSSAMPHKANPVAAEALVALARVNADRVASLHHAMLHQGERDGAAWTTEWMVLPEMLRTAGAACLAAARLLDGLAVNGDAMRARIERAPGLLLSEAAADALARTMPREQALRHVAEAAEQAVHEGGTLLDRLELRLGAVVDWQALRSLGPVVEPAAAETRRIVALLRKAGPGTKLAGSTAEGR